MKLKPLDWRFWQVADTCLSKAAFGFKIDQRNNKTKINLASGFGIETFKESIERKIMLTAILHLSSYEELSFETFKLLAKTIIKEAKEKKQNDFLESINKNRLRNKIELLAEIETELLELFSLIEAYDFFNIKSMLLQECYLLNDLIKLPQKSKFKLGTRYKFKKKYYYEFQIPLITRDSDQLNILMITSTGLESDDFFYDFDLCLTVNIIKKLFPSTVFKSIVVYDIKSKKRIVLNFQDLLGDELIEELFTKLFLIDSISTPKNFNLEKCKVCPQQYFCFSSLFRKVETDKGFEKNKKNKIKNIRQKREILKEEIIKRRRISEKYDERK